MSGCTRSRAAPTDMAVTHSRSVERASAGDLGRRRAGWRGRELLLTVVASLLVAGGLYQVHQAKSEGLAEVEAGLSAKRLLNLNELGAREELLPALAPFFPKSRERDAAVSSSGEMSRSTTFSSASMSSSSRLSSTSASGAMVHGCQSSEPGSHRSRGNAATSTAR